MRLVGCVACVIVSCGCASTSTPSSHTLHRTSPQAEGSSYVVQPGETLWGIAHDFGWDVQRLAAVNRLSDPTQVKVGQRLFIPAPRESQSFFWPARGKISPIRRTGGKTSGQGLEILAPDGSMARASRTGRVAVATTRLAGRGQTVVLDHGDGYVTVYCGLKQMLVSPGVEVRQGHPVGRLGPAPLYFEIRLGTRLLDPLRLLP